ncbi:hypothetical protein CEXT_445921 [Caerostris extrusa]|uniref:Uncharacterized protein n=1 Tax=Caerostris extrusa TaxID=172846 RepID=A0AAV4USX3_CAEEX|nr:hypothetical protein CEXT_445921 [Caerostris extrusa]
MTKKLLKRTQMATGLQVLTFIPLQRTQLFLFKMEGRGSAVSNYAKGKSAKTRFSAHFSSQPSNSQSDAGVPWKMLLPFQMMWKNARQWKKNSARSLCRISFCYGTCLFFPCSTTSVYWLKPPLPFLPPPPFSSTRKVTIEQWLRVPAVKTLACIQARSGERRAISVEAHLSVSAYLLSQSGIINSRTREHCPVFRTLDFFVSDVHN